MNSPEALKKKELIYENWGKEEIVKWKKVRKKENKRVDNVEENSDFQPLHENKSSM
jgi:hypothetical protein